MTLDSPHFLEMDEARHVYYVDGLELPSVTQILDKGGLISEYCRDEEARYRGSRVHELTAEDDVEALDLRKVPASLRGYVRSWRQFRADIRFVPTLIEHRVDDLINGFSGRFDRLGHCEGDGSLVTLLDIKTSNTGAIPAYARLQLAAYALGYNPRKIFLRRVTVLRPDGRYNTASYPVEDFGRDRAEWLALLNSVKQQKQEGN